MMMWLAYHNCTDHGGEREKLTNGALIHVLVASASYKASRTGANGTTIKRVGVTHSAFVARVADTGIIQVAQQTCGETKSKRSLGNQSNSHVSICQTSRVFSNVELLETRLLQPGSH